MWKCTNRSIVTSLIIQKLNLVINIRKIRIDIGMFTQISQVIFAPTKQSTVLDLASNSFSAIF